MTEDDEPAAVEPGEGGVEQVAVAEPKLEVDDKLRFSIDNASGSSKADTV